MQELKDRIRDLNYAIRMTETYFRYCDTPLIKDLYLQSIEFYKKEILIAESQLLAYTNGNVKDQ